MNKKYYTYFFSIILLVLVTSGNLFASGTVNPEQSETAHHLPDVFMVIPFVVLLLMIATGPLFYHHFWEKHYPKVAMFLGSITVVYYLVALSDSHSILHSLAEYLSFIALLA
ncbi:MAG: sodium:proton antiporter, partial [Ignavibacteriaceae bacterium]